ncbi:hypothetical protein, partial [Salmonella enterica]|uniref:hypothetical protein n=2 Tax=Bacteria TaxID=2 RepID=UPI0015CA5188
FEAGHLLGLFDQILPDIGLGLGDGHHTDSRDLRLDDDVVYVGSWLLVTSASAAPPDEVPTYVQVMTPGAVTDLEPGTYRYDAGRF